MEKIYVITILILFQLNISFSQTLSDIGQKSYSEIKSKNKTEACESSPEKMLTYCVSDGSKISYEFDNNILSGIIFQTLHSSKNDAEIDFKNEVSKMTKQIGIEPLYKNGAAFFYYKNSPIFYAFEVKNFQGQFYLYQFILTTLEK